MAEKNGKEEKDPAEDPVLTRSDRNLEVQTDTMEACAASVRHDQSIDSKGVQRARRSFRNGKHEREKNICFEDGSERKDPERAPTTVIRKISKLRASFKQKGGRRRSIKSGENPGVEEDKTTPDCEKEPPDPKMYSVLEVHHFIEQREILRAFSIISAMEQELLDQSNLNQNRDTCSDYDKSMRDVELLYRYLSQQISLIIKESLENELLDENLLTSVVTLIREEEARGWTDPQPQTACLSHTLGLPREWRAHWKKALVASVEERLHRLTLPSGDNTCIALHLAYVAQLIVGDLLKIKLRLKNCYSKDFDVCAAYLNAFHQSASRHVQNNILSQSLKLNDLYAVLDWVTNTYSSESLMGHPDLKPEFDTQDLGPLLDSDALNELQKDYLASFQDTIQKCMHNIQSLQNQKWRKEEEEEMEILDGVYTSELYIDIQQMIGQHVQVSGALSEHIRRETLRISLQELAELIPRLTEDFISWSRGDPPPSFMKYFVSYINGFCGFRSPLQDAGNPESQALEQAITDGIRKLKRYFFEKLKEKTQPQFQQLLTRKWVHCPTAFQNLLHEVRLFLQDLQYLGRPSLEDFLSGVHKYVVTEYITRITKQGLRLNWTNRGAAADKMREEAELINSTMTTLGSDSEWLCPAIPLISGIIGDKREESVRTNLRELASHYPDLNAEHVGAILYLQGSGRKRKRAVMRYFAELGQESPGQRHAERVIFAEPGTGPQVWCFTIFQ
ncbi:exocyst complex component 3-like protein 4 [Ambystoma mexicanum]|uniref:exocyst complex component 3-like protein 4 n=1 Tax=Ambystoma mexicanum TaxID=8296 RepID=UPI0037E79D89